MNELQELRELIIKANTGEDENLDYQIYGNDKADKIERELGFLPNKYWENKPINLAEVLIALENSFEGEDGCFGLNYHHGLFDSWWITLSKSSLGIIETWICKWDLTKDLDHQSPETISSLLKLIKQ